MFQFVDKLAVNLRDGTVDGSLSRRRYSYSIRKRERKRRRKRKRKNPRAIRSKRMSELNKTCTNELVSMQPLQDHRSRVLLYSLTFTMPSPFGDADVSAKIRGFQPWGAVLATSPPFSQLASAGGSSSTTGILRWR